MTSRSVGHWRRGGIREVDDALFDAARSQAPWSLVYCRIGGHLVRPCSGETAD